MAKNITLTKPKYGWSSLTIPCKNDLHEIELSHIDDIPIYFLEHFLSYLNQDSIIEETLVLTIDEEGNEQKIISDAFSTYIINEGDETLDVSEISSFELIHACIEGFRNEIDAWSNFFFDERKPEEKRDTILKMCEDIEEKMRETKSIPN